MPIGSGRSPPVDKVIELRGQGTPNSQIIDNLRQEGFSQQEISDAMSQADIQSEVGYAPTGDINSSIQSQQPLEFPMPPAPEPSHEMFGQEYPAPEYEQQETPSFRGQQPYISESPRENIERVEEIAESVVQEKWEDLIKNFGDIGIWKEKVSNDILAMKQEILRTQERFENLQKALMGKVRDYSKSVTDIGTEMKALEKVFEKILEPLTRNIKELNKITQELKKKK